MMSPPRRRRRLRRGHRLPSRSAAAQTWPAWPPGMPAGDAFPATGPGVTGQEALPGPGIAPIPRLGHDRCMEMRAELVISAPAEDAWAVVGEGFGEIGEWASAIAESSMEGQPGTGQVRTCHVAGFGPVAPGVIKERLIDFDPEAMSLSYEAEEGMPGFIARAVSRWSVYAGPGRSCTVRIHATLTLRAAVRPLGPLLRQRMRADTRQALAELRHRIETGRPHPAKAAALAGEQVRP